MCAAQFLTGVVVSNILCCLWQRMCMVWYWGTLYLGRRWQHYAWSGVEWVCETIIVDFRFGIIFESVRLTGLDSLAVFLKVGLVFLKKSFMEGVCQ